MGADIEELENLDASEIHAWRLTQRRFSAPKNGEHFILPIVDGTVKLSGGDQGIREPTLIRDPSERGEELRGDLRGESDGSQPADTMMDDSEARNFSSIERNYSYRFS